MLPVLLWLSACAPRVGVPPAPAAAEATIAPPFTVAQLRAAHPVGTHLRFRIERYNQPPLEEWWTWTAVDEAGCTITSTVHDATGAALTAEQATAFQRRTGTWRAEWTELSGRFPAARNRIVASWADVPGGRFDTWLVTVRSATDGRRTVSEHHYAQAMPGPPLLVTTEVEGIVVSRTTMVKRSGP
ncbi:MAG: hypothetical protein V4850_32935 [Myxococcota bacterium]